VTTFDPEELDKAVDDIVEWWRDRGRDDVADDLREGATEEQLAYAEQKLGAPLGPELRALYARHDGQRDRESRWFFGDLCFAELSYALDLRQGMVHAYFGVGYDGVRRPETVFADPETPLSDAELDGRWYPVANDIGDFLAVHLGTGRVARTKKGEVPAVRVVAPTLTAFVSEHASALWDDRFDALSSGRIRTS
jgi:hypothetical protein